MARFRATIDGRSRTGASRLGSDMVSATVNGWGIGMDARAFSVDVERTPGGKIKDAGHDEVSVSITGGSGNRSELLSLGTWKRGEKSGEVLPADAIARAIWQRLRRGVKS